MEKGPWLFRDWPLNTKPYDGFSDPELIDLDYMPIWIQVPKIPEGYRKQEIVKLLIYRACGEVMCLEMTPAGGFRGDFVRAHIRQDVRKPLTRFVSISRGGKRFLYAVKYEKLGVICYACGLVGHGQKECGIGVYEEKELKYGEWIYVMPPSSRGRSAGVLRGNSGGGRTEANVGGGRSNCMEGGPGRDQVGRGRGTYIDWRSHPERNVGVGSVPTDRELADTATSPVKQGDSEMSDAEKLAKKRLCV
jgi:hypothetical protein